MLLRTVAAFALLFSCLFAHADYRTNVDLISLHYDHAPDRDDGHAAVAAYMVARSIGFNPYVVSGAYGEHNKSRYQPQAEKVMEATWSGIWVNAHSNWNSAVNQTASAWLQTINKGGDIYVAEGGQSDFTADVIRNIGNQSSINTNQRINVIQHSAWNERMADQADLSYTRNNSNYIKIQDGNNVNATADLNNKSNSFVADARNGQYSSQWNAAFEYLDPNDKLDFSDTVELLYILGIHKDQIATVNDFGDSFFSAVPAQQAAAQGFSTPQPWSDSYSVDGQCYCDTTYDHGLANIQVSTPQGNKTVTQICQAVSNVFGQGPANNRTYYNTVQCGHDPKNTARDETVCPGIPAGAGNYTGPRCNNTGATWNLNALYPAAPVTTPEPAPTPDPVPTTTEETVPAPVPVTTEEPVPAPVPVTTEEPAPVPDPVTTTEVETPTAPAAPVIPVCSASITDDNSDGYGWENNQTCTIDPSVVAAPTATPEPFVFPECSAGITDPEGDGYGWENNQTCTITTVATTTPAATAQPPVFPECSSSVEDFDGDGYGWENNQTCQIPAAPATTTETADSPADTTAESTDTPTNTDSTADSTNASTTTSDPISFPACSSSVIDENNDGYGWENGQSCTIANQSAPDFTAEPSLTVFPACSAALIDTDGDGYGWENNQSCQFPAASTDSPDTSTDASSNNDITNPLGFPACSSGVIDENSDGYGWENGQSCTITSQPAADSASDPLLPIFPVCSPTLLDSDGDGYGWENNQTCQVNPQNTGDQSTAEAPLFVNCSAAVVDSDGDGYGWENNQTCQFENNPANNSQNPSGNEQAPVVLANFPECSANITDADGDGYGWENNQSCQFSAAQGTSSNQPPLVQVTFPACSSAITDTNGDGYGWENNRSCFFEDPTGSAPSNPVDQSIAIINFPTCSDSAVDHDNDGFSWENNQSCSMPTQTAQSDQPPLALVTFPTCSNQLIDADGDGYGWENNQSCMFSQTTTNPATGTLETVSITGVIYRICSATAVDDNNDGFAWENNATCVIAASIPTLLQLAEFPPCSNSLIDENQDGFGWENGRSCRFVN